MNGYSVAQLDGIDYLPCASALVITTSLPLSHQLRLSLPYLSCDFDLFAFHPPIPDICTSENSWRS